MTFRLKPQKFSTGFADKRDPEVLRWMRGAPDMEGISDQHPVMPGNVLALRDLRVGMLLFLNRPLDAWSTFDRPASMITTVFDALMVPLEHKPEAALSVTGALGRTLSGAGPPPARPGLRQDRNPHHRSAHTGGL